MGHLQGDGILETHIPENALQSKTRLHKDMYIFKIFCLYGHGGNDDGRCSAYTRPAVAL